MKKHYARGHQLMARILVISLFLQNCGGFRHAMSPGEKGGAGVTPTVDVQHLIGHEFMADRGNLVTFSQQKGQLQADVRVDAAQEEPNYRNLPVNIAADIDLTKLVALDQKGQQRRIHFNCPNADQPGSVSIIKAGLLGGMVREEDEEETIPNECFCPITQEIMEDPVIAQDGHSYERSAIAYWLNLGHRTSPKTGARLLSTELTPNHTMRSLIQDLKAQMPVLARHKLEMSTIESAVKLREEEIQHVLELKRDLLQQVEQKVVDLEKQLKELRLNQQQFDEVVLVFGHSGVGKSVLCNTIIGNDNPKIAIGQQAYIAARKLYVEIDTSDLTNDSEKGKQTAATIEKALQYGDNHKVVFVITLEDGKLKQEDCMAITAVCNSMKFPFQYGLILNKIKRATLEEIVQKGSTLYLLAPLSKKPHATVVIPEKEKVGFSLSSENKHKLMIFFDQLEGRNMLQQEIKNITTLERMNVSSSLEKERLEAARLEKDRLEKERLEQERLERERLEKERKQQEIEQEKAALRLRIDHYFFRHATKKNIDWSNITLPKEFYNFEIKKQGVTVALIYKELLYDNELKYGGWRLLARNCYKRNKFLKILSPQELGFTCIEPKSYNDEEYNKHWIRYLRDGSLRLVSLTAHSNSPFYAKITLENTTNHDISFTISQGNIIEVEKFIRTQNLAIIGEIEFFDDGNHTNYKLKPLPKSFRIGAGVTETITVSCACDDARYGSPDGEVHYPTNYEDNVAKKIDPRLLIALYTISCRCNNQRNRYPAPKRTDPHIRPVKPATRQDSPIKKDQDKEEVEKVRQVEGQENGGLCTLSFPTTMYFKSRGIPDKDRNKNNQGTFKLHQQVVDQGNIKAPYHRGRMYMDGLVFSNETQEENDKQVVDFFQKLADQGIAEAQNNLASMYRSARGIPISDQGNNDKKAVAWYEKAAAQGLVEAQANLGKMYMKGYGVSKNDQQAVAWFKAAADKGFVPAKNLLGLMYKEARGMPTSDQEINNKKAVALFQEAAVQGNAKAQFNLGIMYSGGLGVDKDKAKAIAWYQKAAVQGHKGARDLIDHYFFRHATKKNIDWSNITLPKEFYNFEVKKQGVTVALIYKELLYDDELKYGGWRFLARTCYKRNGFIKLLSPKQMGFTQIEPKNLTDPAYDQQLISYLREGSLIMERLTGHISAPIYASMLIKNVTNQDITFFISKGQVLEQIRFYNASNLAITGILVEAPDEVGEHHIAPIETRAFTVKANGQAVINVTCACIDQDLPMPNGEGLDMTPYIVPEVRDLKNLEQSVVGKNGEETHSPKDICNVNNQVLQVIK
eukprot:gene3032-3791_t